MVESCCALGCQHCWGQAKGRAFNGVSKDLERRQKWITVLRTQQDRLFGAQPLGALLQALLNRVLPA